MKKEFIPYEQALELKELRFDEPCIGVYGYNKLSKSVPDNLIDKNVISYIQDIITAEEFVLDFNDLRNCNIGDNNVSAPTFSQAFRWFREKHQIVFCYEPCLKKDLTYIFFIYVEVTGEKVFVVESKYNEEAELACLIKLIEIVKK